MIAFIPPPLLTYRPIVILLKYGVHHPYRLIVMVLNVIVIITLAKGKEARVEELIG